MKKFRETYTLNGVKSVPMDTANPVAVVRVDEKTMQLWERDPMRYRDQIMTLEKKMNDELKAYNDQKASWYYRQDLLPEERIVYINNGYKMYKLSNKLSELVAKIRDEEYKIKLSEINRTIGAHIRKDKAKPQKRRNVISNGPQVLIQTAEQYVMSLMMKQCITIGKA